MYFNGEEFVEQTVPKNAHSKTRVNPGHFDCPRKAALVEKILLDSISGSDCYSHLHHVRRAEPAPTEQGEPTSGVVLEFKPRI